MKNHIAAGILLILLICFCLFYNSIHKYKVVMEVKSPTKISVNSGNNSSTDYENICIDGIESFSLEPNEEFFNKYSTIFNLSNKDIISLGYMANEYAEKLLLNKRIVIKYTNKKSSECNYASIKLNGMNYKKLLQNSGFGITNNKIGNKQKYEKNLKIAQKLNLVIFNHHSQKFHSLDCPYGNVAHDKVIIPQKNLPKEAKPCKFCHNEHPTVKKVFSYKKDADIFNIPQIIQPLLTIADGDIKLIYTDCTKMLKPNTNCNTTACKELLSLIESSKESIDIAIYGYDNNQYITSALARAKTRGVKIRYVYDETFKAESMHYKDNNLISMLAETYTTDKNNSETKSNMIMHNKFIIFDNKIVYTGSMNISKSGLSGYDVNDIIIVSSSEVAALYTKEFEQMLNGNFHKQKSKITYNNRFLLGDSELEVYFSPKDAISNRIIDIISNAQSYIYVPTYLITHKRISESLINAKKKGIDVRIIIDANSTSIKNSKHKLLRENGVLLKTENYAGKLHSKTLIIDDEYLITGSMNFSNSGENKNDENILIIKNKKLASAHKDFFLYLWTLIPNKYLKQNARPEAPDSIGSCYDGVDNNFNGKIDSEEEYCSNHTK